MENVSKGLGDTIAKFTEVTGIDKVVKTVASTIGIEDCGCKARQEMLNKLIPYNVNQVVSPKTQIKQDYVVFE